MEGIPANVDTCCSRSLAGCVEVGLAVLFLAGAACGRWAVFVCPALKLPIDVYMKAEAKMHIHTYKHMNTRARQRP